MGYQCHPPDAKSWKYRQSGLEDKPRTWANTVAALYDLAYPSVLKFVLTITLTGFIWATFICKPKTHNNHDFLHLDNYCAHVLPIEPAEIQLRQAALASTLHNLNASAYIAEPGASALFYGNVSWHLSERPLLLIISPNATGAPKISILTPKFEATRAKQLVIPSVSDHVTFIEWAEESSPYEALISMLDLPENAQLFVDASARFFVVDGLAKALPKSATLSAAPLEVRRLRERKSSAELEILKCANEATLLVIRTVQKRLQVGMRESTARSIIASALATAGLKDAECLTLFGENAALPHGSGTDRALKEDDFALFDCTGMLHNYWSDVTRTVAIPQSKIPAENMEIWNYVLGAQTHAFQIAREGVLTGAVDAAAREYLTKAGRGYSQWFSHRLGHGIGLEVHEDPYLRGGTSDAIQIGHTFSNEPGVYIEGKVGIRLEDCFYIDQHGEAVLLTAGQGGQATSPHLP